MDKKAFAEIIASSLTEWQAQSWSCDVFPEFGSLVSVQQSNRIFLGLVYHISTGPLDNQRVAYAYKKTEQELRREQPQIFELLRTTFSCCMLGFIQENKLFYQTAPEPPRMHAFVSNIDVSLEHKFFSNHHYIYLLFAHAQKFFNLDEVLLAMINQLHKKDLLSDTILEQFVQEFRLLAGNDYRRVKLFIQRIEHSVSLKPLV